MEIFSNDGLNWPIWQAKITLIFRSKGLLPHILGTAVEPRMPPDLVGIEEFSDLQQERLDKYEEKLDRFNAKEGLAMAQIIISVSETMGLLLKKHLTAHQMWEALVEEMTKKPKMVIITLQRKLRTMKCSEEDNIWEHLDKATDIYSRLKEMGGALIDRKSVV